MKWKTSGIFVIYSRKSRFTGKGESVENQIELCRQYISRMHGSEVAETALIYEDEGFSGGNLERPQFKKMMKDSREQKFAAIVVYRLDRISRNIGDFAKLIEDLGDRGIDFISIKEQFDTSSPMGRAMMYIASVFSQLERETIAERIRDNMHELAKTGRWLGGTTPTGYASESVTTVSADGKSRKAYKLAPVPEEVNLVKTIFRVFMETGSQSKVDEYMLEHQIKTRRGNAFTRYAIRGILENPVYMIADEDALNYFEANHVELYADQSAFDGVHGIMAYNRTLQKTGRSNQINPMDEWIVSVGRHPGLIPGDQWVTVQKKLALNKAKNYRRPRSNAALLSGLLICGKCGDYMRPKASQRKTAEGNTIFTYMCSTKERSHSKVCDIKNVNGNTMDAQVLSAIKEMGQNSNSLSAWLTQARQILRGSQDGSNAELIKVRAELRQIEEQSRNLVDTLSRAGGMAAERYIMERIGELNQSAENSRTRMEHLESAARRCELADMEFRVLNQMLTQFGESIDDFCIEQKRAAVRALVKRVIWDGENIHLYIFGREGDTDFPSFPSEKDIKSSAANEVPPGEDSK